MLTQIIPKITKQLYYTNLEITAARETTGLSQRKFALLCAKISGGKWSWGKQNKLEYPNKVYWLHKKLCDKNLDIMNQALTKALIDSEALKKEKG
jgi:hypothetical protein